MKNTARKRPEETNEAAEFEAAVREGLAEANSGKAISYSKIRRWLLSWGSDEELPPPK